MLSKVLLAFFAIMFSGMSFAKTHLKVPVGTPSSMLSGLPDADRANSLTPSNYTFTTAEGNQVSVLIDTYYYVGGELGMSGDPERSGSDFILKGNDKNLYGWVIIKSEDRAFEYTTGSDGKVYAQEVPITKIYPTCFEEQEGAEFEVNPVKENKHALNFGAAEDHIKPYDGQNLSKLQSLPGSKKVLWLDIRDIMNGDTPKHFSKKKLYESWQIFASSYSMFDVNVTTDKSVYDKAGSRNGGINHLDNKKGRSFCCLNCFGTGRKCETQLQSDREYPDQYGKTMAHESGHQMGLGHDGNGNTDYFTGFKEFEWSPTMGNNRCCRNWNSALAQWSKGEYASASNKQDDLSIILKNLPYRKDDVTKDRPLSIDDGKIDPTDAENRGQISGKKDTDTFTFTLDKSSAVKLSVQITEPNHGSALDIQASIVNSSGKTVVKDNKVKNRNAEFSQNLEAGTYKLVISGGAEGTPKKGFSSYATMGFYAVSGSID